jgi:prepilin peptidase CpaA
LYTLRFNVTHSNCSLRRAVEKYLLIGALAVATAGAVKDVIRRRIPNSLTYSGIVTGLLVRAALLGWAGFRGGFLGLLAGGGIFYVLFLLGGMGGGDVKLMGAVGAWAGIAQTATLLVTTAIAGGVLAVGYMIFHQRVRIALSNTVELMRHHFTKGLKPHPMLNVREADTLRIPYGLAIAIGTVYCVGTIFWRG